MYDGDLPIRKKEEMDLATEIHKKYEEFSKKYNWQPQESCRDKAFEDLPINNQIVMCELARWLLKKFA